MAISGGCLCGNLRYEVRKEVLASHATSFCHCRMCQKVSGAPVLVFSAIPEDALGWTAGKPKTYKSSASVVREFCGHCGCQMTYAWHRPGDVVFELATFTLDDPDAVPPGMHEFCSSQLDWLVIQDELPRYEGFCKS